MKKHAFLIMAHNEFTMLKKIMQSLDGEFGLSPATRSRIIAAGGMSDKTSDDPMEQLLNGQWKEGE